MNAVRHRLRTWTWVALVAVLALALLPTLSRAWAPEASGAPAHAGMEVCTAEGLRLMPAPDDGQDPAPAHHADAFERCAHCVLGGAPVVPLPSLPVWQPADLSGQALPALFLQAPHTLHAWASAQPRAPPALS